MKRFCKIGVGSSYWFIGVLSHSFAFVSRKFQHFFVNRSFTAESVLVFEENEREMKIKGYYKSTFN